MTSFVSPVHNFVKGLFLSLTGLEECYYDIYSKTNVTNTDSTRSAHLHHCMRCYITVLRYGRFITEGDAGW